MSLRAIVRFGGALLIVAGLSLLAYAAFSYAQASLAEREAETHVPGQASEVAEMAPTAPPSSPTNTETATPLPSPTLTPPRTELRATEAPTLQTVVGPQGLPRGKGADPTRLIIPKLRLDTRIEEASWAVVAENGMAMSEWQIPYDAVAHLSTTPKPGEAGNAVISGHDNLVGPNVFGLGKFAGLWNLRAGDSIFVFDALGRVFLYHVARYYTLRELGEPLSVRTVHAQEILKDSLSPVVTFETCWNGAQAPLSGNTYRWIVVANLVGTVDPIEVTRAAD